jgi:uncharacterized protein
MLLLFLVRSYSLASSVANDFAAKAYVASLGQGLNEELKKLGVNVTVLLPGVTDTPVLAKLGFNVWARR